MKSRDLDQSVLFAAFLILLRIGQLVTIILIVLVTLPLIIAQRWSSGARRINLWIARNVTVRFLPRSENI